HVQGVPPVDNDASAVAAMTAAVGAVLGPTAIVPTRQSLGGEDLGWLLTEVPGAMARLGTRTPGGLTHELQQGGRVVGGGSVLTGAQCLAAAALSAVGPDGLV